MKKTSDWFGKGMWIHCTAGPRVKRSRKKGRLIKNKLQSKAGRDMKHEGMISQIPGIYSFSLSGFTRVHSAFARNSSRGSAIIPMPTYSLAGPSGHTDGFYLRYRSGKPLAYSEYASISFSSRKHCYLKRKRL